MTQEHIADCDCYKTYQTNNTSSATTTNTTSNTTTSTANSYDELIPDLPARARYFAGLEVELLLHVERFHKKRSSVHGPTFTTKDQGGPCFKTDTFIVDSKANCAATETFSLPMIRKDHLYCTIKASKQFPSKSTSYIPWVSL
jgi:hypothetical protein